MPEKPLKPDIQLRAATSAGSRIFVSHLGLDTATWFFVSQGLGAAANLSDHWVYVSQQGLDTATNQSDHWVFVSQELDTATNLSDHWVFVSQQGLDTATNQSDHWGFRFTSTRHCDQPV